MPDRSGSRIPRKIAWDAILFDFDGVLADSELVHHRCWNQALQPFGIQFSWEEYQKQCIGVADRIIAERLQVQDPAGVVLRKESLFRESLEISPPFLEETLALVRELAQFHRIAVVSSSHRPDVEPPLVRAGIRDCFEDVICGDQVRRLKPAPEPYLLAAERMRLRKPLVVEDSAAGVAAGQAAGFEVLRVSTVEAVAREVRAKLRE